MRIFVTHLVLLAVLAASASGQEFGERQSLGVSGSFAPRTGHILIGEADQRRFITAGVEYTHPLPLGKWIGAAYQGSVMPFFQESDPTQTGTEVTLFGDTTVFPYPTPVGPVQADGTPQGEFIAGPGSTSLILAVYGSPENTYAVAITPLGVRINGFRRRRMQPTFAAEGGILYASRDLIVDNTSKFNVLFSAGPGAEVFLSTRQSIRFDCLYRHVSTAGLGQTDPGVDSEVFRFTLSRYK